MRTPLAKLGTFFGEKMLLGGGHFFTIFVSFWDAPLSKGFEHPSSQKQTNLSKKIPTFAVPSIFVITEKCIKKLLIVRIRSEYY